LRIYNPPKSPFRKGELILPPFGKGVRGIIFVGNGKPGGRALGRGKFTLTLALSLEGSGISAEIFTGYHK